MSSRKQRIKSSSSAIDVTQSSRSEPWSVEWLHNLQHGDVGLISSKKKRLKKAMKVGDGNRRRGAQFTTKKKAGVLQHPVLILKKVAGDLVKIGMR